VSIAIGSLVCAADGPLDVPTDRWLGAVDAADLSVIDRVRGPALDVGCGPGRHVVALAERGVRAMGIDVTPCALHHARARGAPVLRRSVFDRVPATGRWVSALLLDGNVGIGGDPVALLARVATLVTADGAIFVEVDPPGLRDGARTVRLDIGGHPGPWFALATVALDSVGEHAARAGLVVREQWSVDGRWFAALGKVQS
jgi:SAM-dependent methyltransferase